MRTVMSKPVIVLAFVLALASAGSAYGQLRGHGGPVRALAISPDGREAVSGSFDTAVIRWSLQRNAAEQVLRSHEGAAAGIRGSLQSSSARRARFCALWSGRACRYGRLRSFRTAAPCSAAAPTG